MKIFLTGSDGQLGKALSENIPKDIILIKASKNEFNLSKPEEIDSILKRIEPDWIINCGAFTNVEKAEVDFQEAFSINYLAVKQISNTIKNLKTKLLHISTDYVFNGEKNIPYQVDSERNPINKYGESKALGENVIEKILSGTNKAVIVRTSWLVSHIGDNFVKKILNRLVNYKGDLKVVDDQFGSITSTYSLSEACWEIVTKWDKKDFKSETIKIFHWSSRGVVSWYEIACEINNIAENMNLIKSKMHIIPIKSYYFNSKAKRPKYSVLDLIETKKYLDTKVNYWKDDLFEIIKNIKKEKNLGSY